MKVGDRVVYVPNHANGDRNHPDCERGMVHRINEEAAIVFVLFDGDYNPKGCYPHNLLVD